MNTLIPGAPLRSLSPTTNEYQRAQGESRAAKPARAARFTLDAPEHSGTIPGARGDILTPGVALTSNLAVIFTLNQHTTTSSTWCDGCWPTRAGMVQGSGISSSIRPVAGSRTPSLGSPTSLIGLRKDAAGVFDSIIVVTDRRILDRQICDTIKQFAQVGATVGHAERSANLRTFIESGKKIIISTVQKFPFILDEIGNEQREPALRHHH